MRPEAFAGPLVLGFDAAAAHCAAALVSGGRLLASREEPMATGQAERLMPMLEEMLAEAGAAWSDLDGLGVGTGPGNFTGTRIAAAAARGLALGLGIPAVGVSAFEALGYGRDSALALRDARLGQVHALAWGPVAFGPLTLGLADPLPSLSPGTPVMGDPGSDLAEAIAIRTGGQAVPPRLPLAEATARLALARLAAPGPRPAPLYLRAPDAAPPRDPAPVLLPG